MKKPTAPSSPPVAANRPRPNPTLAQRPAASAKQSNRPVGRSKAAIAIVAVAAVTIVAGIVVVGAVYMNSGTPEKQVVENKEEQPAGQVDGESKKDAPKKQPKDKTIEKKQPPTEQPKDKGAEKKEPPAEQPKDKVAVKTELPIEQPKDNAKDSKGTPADSKVDFSTVDYSYDFSRVGYTYDFSKVEFTKGPEGQVLEQWSSEERQNKASIKPLGSSPMKPEEITDCAYRLLGTFLKRHAEARPFFLNLANKNKIPSVYKQKSLRPDITDFTFRGQIANEEMAKAWIDLMRGKMPPHFEFLADGKPVETSAPGETIGDPFRFVEQGYYAERKLTPDDIADTARQLFNEWRGRYPKAHKLYLKQVKVLPPLRVNPLRPDITDFRYLTNATVNEAVVLNKQQKAFLILLDGEPVTGELYSLNAKEVHFKRAKEDNTSRFEASKVKAVLTDNGTYFYSGENNSFINLHTCLPYQNDGKLLRPKQTQLEPKGWKTVVLLASGQQVVGAFYEENPAFKQIQFTPAKGKMVKMKTADIKVVQTNTDIYFPNPDKKGFGFIGLTSLRDFINKKEAETSEEAKATAWLQLTAGEMPSNVEFLDYRGKTVDVNKMFVRHGRTKGEYVTKGESSIAYEELWFKGLKHGPSLYYHRNGKKKSEEMFVNGNRHGVHKRYFDDGRLQAEVHWVDGKKHGLEKTFYANGGKELDHVYVNGEPHGILVDYFEDGTIRAEVHWVQGKKHGTEKRLYANGKMQNDHVYVNGMAHGILMDYFEDGTLRAEGHWVQGKEHGPRTTYYSNGQKEEYRVFVNGLTQGRALGFHSNGQLAIELACDKGKVTARTQWYDNGAKEFQMGFDAFGAQGVATSWYRNGNKKAEGTYTDGRRVGLWTWWDEGGQRVKNETYPNSLDIAKEGTPKGGWDDRNGPGEPNNQETPGSITSKRKVGATVGVTVRDEDGFICHYQCKCDKCGYVSPTIHSGEIPASSSAYLKSSWFCPKCKHLQDLRIYGQ